MISSDRLDAGWPDSFRNILCMGSQKANFLAKDKLMKWWFSQQYFQYVREFSFPESLAACTRAAHY